MVGPGRTLLFSLFALVVFLSILQCATGRKALQQFSGEASREATVGGKGSTPTCVCVFDFDETLRVYDQYSDDWDSVPKDAAKVIQACLSAPCAIAIASANDNRDKIICVLSSRYSDLGVFTSEFFSSPAFQYGDDNKGPMLIAIARFFNIKDLSCLTLLDDKIHNGDYANQAGTQFVLVDPIAGVQSHDFNAALKAWPDQCLPGGKPSGL